MAEIDYRLAQSASWSSAFPGPESRRSPSAARRPVAAGVASSLPVFADELDGGVIEDVDGKSNGRILAPGIAVTSVGASAPQKAAARVQDAVAKFTDTRFMVTRTRMTWRWARKTAQPTPRVLLQAHRAVHVGLGGSGERREDRARAHQAAGGRPCPTTCTMGARTAMHGHDRQGDAVQAGLRPFANAG
ncbi:hypothetical protein QJS66_10290 [Kocuria rhizophila]|nr:hypothetical protein QJS66_10290 [Kocuria rhizophila]